MVTLILALLAALAPQAAAPEGGARPTHCATGERIVFSCATASGKVASLCRTRAGLLAYRFGPPGDAELVYPPVPGEPREHFRGSRVIYAGGGGAWLGFDHGGFTFFVYTASGRDWAKEGVLVRKGDVQVASLPCESGLQSEIGPDLFEELDLPAGADEFDVP